MSSTLMLAAAVAVAANLLVVGAFWAVAGEGRRGNRTAERSAGGPATAAPTNGRGKSRLAELAARAAARSPASRHALEPEGVLPGPWPAAPHGHKIDGVLSGPWSSSPYSGEADGVLPSSRPAAQARSGT